MSMPASNESDRTCGSRPDLPRLCFNFLVALLFSTSAASDRGLSRAISFSEAPGICVASLVCVLSCASVERWRLQLLRVQLSSDRCVLEAEFVKCGRWWRFFRRAGVERA